MASPTRSTVNLDLGKLLGHLQTAPNPISIVINGGRPTPYEALAFRGARVQFQNNDNQTYRIQITNIVTLDYYLPPFGTLTVFVNKAATVPSEIDYDLAIEETPPSYPHLFRNAVNAQTAETAFAGSDALSKVSAFAETAFPASDEVSAVADSVEADTASVGVPQTLFAASGGPGGRIIVKG